MKQITDIIKELENPEDEFSPIPFWFFNDEPDEQKIRKQLEDYKEKGVCGIVLHPRIGIPKKLKYLSEAYFNVVRFIVETANQINMKIVLYDEGMYPSGSAHGMVVEQNPEYASKGITLVSEPGNQTVLAELDDGNYLVKDFTGGTIRGIHFGEDDGETGAPLSADILNPDAVSAFIHLTHDRYYDHLQHYFGKTIIGFFTDEPCALGRNAGNFREWAEGMELEIQESGGKIEELEGLFTGEENSTTVLYHQLVKKHLRENFYGQLSTWCSEHEIAFMGHPAESDDVEEELYFHIPGQDLIMRRVVPKTGGLLEPDSVLAKLSADIARHLGCRRNANECFGVCYRDNIPWYFTGEDMKWYIDWLAIRGVNLFIPHAFYYSIDGARKEERPPDVGPNNIWWKHYKLFSDYMKRLSFLMTDSVNGAKIAVLCDNNRVPCEEVSAFYEHQIEFNYLPVAMLSACRAENGQLCIREYRYDYLLDTMNFIDSDDVLGVKIARSWSDIISLYGGEDKLPRLFKTDQFYRELRAVHLKKYETDLYFLSNEGGDKLQLDLVIPETQTVIFFDLWSGRYKTICSRTEKDEVKISEILNPCETVLLALDKSKICTDFPRPKTHIEDWTDKFSMVYKSNNKAVYQYTYFAERSCEELAFEVTGEEMAECYCNDEPIGVSFWNTHRFKIGPYLRQGKNEIKLVFTGNASNIYEDANIYYGI